MTATCEAQMASLAVDNHIHTCVGHVHSIGSDHFCAVCGRWWFSRE